MFKILIVDDEEWVRERLRYTIDWLSYGIEVAGDACDGEEALIKTEKLHPDIVITDIRMPCIDGLEFIKRLRENNNNAKVIIISGYSDFDYAQKAIKLGAFDYILKPIEDSDLINVIEKCLREISSNKNKDILLEKAKEQIEESQTILREKFFINLINGYFLTEEDIEKQLLKHNICLGSSSICFIVEFDELRNNAYGRALTKNTAYYSISRAIENSLNKIERIEFSLLYTGEIVCLVFSGKDSKMLRHEILLSLDNIKTTINESLGYKITIGIGNAYNSLISISASYREASEALQYKAYMGSGRIYDIGNIEAHYKSNYHRLKDIEILINNIKIGDKEKALSTLSKMIKSSKMYGDVYPIDLKLLYLDIVNSIFKTIIHVKASYDDFSDLNFRFFKQLNLLQTTEETYNWLCETISKIIDMLESYKNVKKRKIIEQALEYIENHYCDQITLNDVASRLYMNASYFCKVFSEEMGESFTKYFSNLRIQKAKELMTNPTLKIYEIAGMVGYTDVQYFTKIFKSVEGVTPVQYREKIK